MWCRDCRILLWQSSGCWAWSNLPVILPTAKPSSLVKRPLNLEHHFHFFPFSCCIHAYTLFAQPIFTHFKFQRSANYFHLIDIIISMVMMIILIIHIRIVMWTIMLALARPPARPHAHISKHKHLRQMIKVRLRVLTIQLDLFFIFRYHSIYDCYCWRWWWWCCDFGCFSSLFENVLRFYFSFIAVHINIAMLSILFWSW